MILQNLYDSFSCKTNSECLIQIISDIEDCFAVHDLASVDTLLRDYDPAKSNTLISIAVLRVSFRARAELIHWTACRDRVHEHLTLQKDDVNRLMRGLLSRG